MGRVTVSRQRFHVWGRALLFALGLLAGFSCSMLHNQMNAIPRNRGVSPKSLRVQSRNVSFVDEWTDLNDRSSEGSYLVVKELHHNLSVYTAMEFTKTWPIRVFDGFPGPKFLPYIS